MTDYMELVQRQEPLHPELKACLETGGPFGKNLKHPLVFAVPYIEQMNAVYNEQFRWKTTEIAKALTEKKWGKYFILHERPYRLQRFYEVADEMSDKEYWEDLGWLWVDCENLWQYKYIARQLITSDRPQRERIMDEDEQELFKKLPDEFTIYRGHHRKNKIGMSWTLSYGRARWFSRRWHIGQNGVIKASCPKEAVLAVFLGRGEFEVVVDPINLKDTKTVRAVRRPAWAKRIHEFAEKGFALSHNRSDHGMWHWEQVERNALTLAKQVPGCDDTVVRLFAMLHDSKRTNENDDPDHGRRAADYVKDLFQEGSLPIDENQLEKLATACAEHNDGKTSTDPTIGVCWDADRLDLTRVGTVPDPMFFSTDAGKKLIWRG